MPSLKRAMPAVAGPDQHRQDLATGAPGGAMPGLLGLLGTPGGGNAAMMSLLRSPNPSAAARDTAGRSIFDAGAQGARGGLPYRDRLERSFGADLSGLEVYQGPEAGAALGQLGAGGAYADGRVLLPPGAPLEVVGEEVAHALQDRGGGGRGVSTGAEPAEREARDAGRAVAQGRPAAVQERTTAGVHRSGLWDWAKDTYSSAKEGVSNAWEGTKDWAGDKISDAGQGISNAWDGAKSWAGDKLSDAGEGISNAWSGAKDWAGDKLSDAGEGISNAWDGAKSWAGDKLSGAGEGISNAWDGATGWLGDTVSGGWSALREGGLGGLGDYASSKWSEAQDGVSGAWDGAKGWLGDAWGQAKGGVSGAWDSAKGWLGNTWDQAKGGVSGAWDSAKGWLGDTWEQAKGGVSGAWDSAKGWLGDTWDQAKGGMSNAWESVKGWGAERGKALLNVAADGLVDGVTWLNGKYDEAQPWINRIRGGLDSATDWTRDNVAGGLDWLGWDSGADWVNNKVEDVRDLFGLDEDGNSFTHHMEVPQNADGFVQQYTELGVPLTAEAWAYQDRIDGGKLHELYNTALIQNLASSNKIDPASLPEDLNSLSDEQLQALADKSSLQALSSSGVLDQLIADNKLDADSIPEDFSTMDPAQLKELAATVSDLGATQDLFDAMPTDQRTAFQENLLDTYINMANNDPNAAVILELMPTETSPPSNVTDILGDALLKGQEPNDFYVGENTGKIREGSVAMSEQLSDPNGQNKNVYGLVVPYSNSVENIVFRDGKPTDATEHVHNYLSKLDQDTTSLLTGYSQGGAGVLDYVRTHGDDDGLDYAVALAPMGGANVEGEGGNGVWGGDFNGVRTLSLANKNDRAQDIWGENLAEMVPGMVNFARFDAEQGVRQNYPEYADLLSGVLDHLATPDADHPLGGNPWVHAGYPADAPNEGTYGYPTDIANLLIRDLLDPSKTDEYYAGSYDKRGEWDWDHAPTIINENGEEVPNPYYKMPDPSEYEDWAETYRNGP